MKYCGFCGHCNDDNAKFCGGCGKAFQTTSSSSQDASNPSWVDHINDYVGNDRPADLNWKVLFTDVLKKHSKSEAETLLSDIAREFQTISGTNSRFEVASVLRTKEDVSKLQSRNSNATSNSCHCYATTFDISYVSFKTDVLHPKNNAELRVALSQTVYNMRKQDRCYVKFENNQKCYHITVR